MSNQPKVGMNYEDVRTRVKRIAQNPGDVRQKGNLINSLLNQAKLKDGDGARRELEKELRIR